MKGKKVANWLGGNEFELFAALTKNGIDPKKSSDVTIVQQPFDMNLFLQRKVDAASAMTYNELAQVLEAKNPKTGKLNRLSDLNVIKMQSRRAPAMLEDGIFATGGLAEERGQPGDRRQVPRRDVRRAGSTAATTPGVHRTSCSRTGRRSAGAIRPGR